MPDKKEQQAQEHELGVATWYLQIDNDNTYGPVPLSTLIEWAEAGRVKPGNMLSPDRNNWVPAESITELKMDWLTAPKSGEPYGPFNLLATPALLGTGRIKATDILRNRNTGKKTPVKNITKATEEPEEKGVEANTEPSAESKSRKKDFGKPLLRPTDIDTKPKQTQTSKSSAEIPLRILQLTEELSTTLQALEKTRGSLDNSKKEVKQTQNSLDSLQTRYDKETNKLSESLAMAKNELTAARNNIKQRDKQLQEEQASSRKTEEQLTSRLDTSTREAAAATTELQSTRRSIEDIRSDHEAFRSESQTTISEQASTITKTREQLTEGATLSRTLKEQLKQAEATEETYVTRCNSFDARIKELEQESKDAGEQVKELESVLAEEKKLREESVEQAKASKKDLFFQLDSFTEKLTLKDALIASTSDQLSRETSRAEEALQKRADHERELLVELADRDKTIGVAERQHAQLEGQLNEQQLQTKALLDAARNKEEAMTSRLLAFEDRTTSLNKTIEQLQTTVEDAKAETTFEQANTNDLRAELEKQEQEKKASADFNMKKEEALNKQIDTLTNQATSLNNRIEDLKQERTDTERQLQELRLELARGKTVQHEAAQQHAAKQKDLSNRIQALSDQLEQKHDSLAKLGKRLQDETTAAQAATQAHTIHEEQLLKEIKKRDKEHATIIDANRIREEDLNNQIQRFSDKLAVMSATLDDVRQQRIDADNEMQSTRKALDAAILKHSDELSTADNQRADLEHNLKHLRDQVARRDKSLATTKDKLKKETARANAATKAHADKEQAFLDQLDEMITTAQSRHSQQYGISDELNKQKQLNTAMGASHRQKEEKLAAQLQARNSQLRAFDVKMDKVETNLKKELTRSEELEENLKNTQLETGATVITLKEEVTSLTTRLDKTNKQLVEHKNSENLLKLDLDTRDTRQEDNDRIIADLKTRLEQAEKGHDNTPDHSELQQRLEEARSETAKLTQELSGTREQLKLHDLANAEPQPPVNKEQIKSLQDEAAKTLTELAEAQEQIRALKQNTVDAEAPAEDDARIKALENEADTAKSELLAAQEQIGLLEKSNAQAATEMADTREQLAKQQQKEPQKTDNTSQQKALAKLTDKLQKPSGLEQWYVKMKDDKLYGPTGIAALRDWAEDCRLAPDDKISTDKENWISAEAVPELEMEWLVKLQDGSAYGPVNLMAIMQLIRDGIINGDSHFTHKVTRQHLSANAVLSPEITLLSDKLARRRDEEKKLLDQLAQMSSLQNKIQKSLQEEQ